MSEAQVIDATLREGMQTRAGTFSASQSREVARLLVRAGVDTVECGHPSVSDDEIRRVREVVEECGDVPVLTHARLRRGDISASAATGAQWVGVFAGVSELSRRSRFDFGDVKHLYTEIHGAIRYAHDLGMRVRFTIEDASRSDQALVLAAMAEAVDAGVDRLCFADTVGCSEPTAVAAFFRQLLRELPDVATEGHFHDDRGLAMANALAALDSGCTFISTSVNSLGERAGITDLAALLVNLHIRSGRDLPPKDVLPAVSQLVGTYSRSPADHRRPVVGRDVFHHSSRLHTRAVQRDATAYEFIDPALLGREHSLGTTAVSRRLDELVVHPRVVSAATLPYHRHGPGDRFVLVDDSLVPGANQYCIARRLPDGDHGPQGHVDIHAHVCDSLFVFLGEGIDYTGLTVEVLLESVAMTIESPAAVFIPAGARHAYRAISGGGTYVNHVLAGTYTQSLLVGSQDSDSTERSTCGFGIDEDFGGQNSGAVHSQQEVQR